MDFIRSEYENKNDEKNKFLDGLKNIIINSKCNLEGNYFCLDNGFNIIPELYPKQLNLFWCGIQANKNVCEIGFNAGHSAMLILLGKNIENLNFTIFDIGNHLYTRPCFEYIQSNFSNVNFEYIEGDSTITIPKWIDNNKDLMGKYDLVHVDGGHTEDCISNDMINADILIKINGIIVIDDTDYEIINKYVDLYISKGNYIELELLKTEHFSHRIIKKIK
jgi:hypothetical protein